MPYVEVVRCAEPLVTCGRERVVDLRRRLVPRPGHELGVEHIVLDRLVDEHPPRRKAFGVFPGVGAVANSTEIVEAAGDLTTEAGDPHALAEGLLGHSLGGEGDGVRHGVEPHRVVGAASPGVGRVDVVDAGQPVNFVP